MPGSVDQVEHVLIPIVCLIGQANGVSLDRDATLPLEVHRIQDLRLHLARLKGTGHLQEPVREGGLTVVDMGDD